MPIVEKPQNSGLVHWSTPKEMDQADYRSVRITPKPRPAGGLVVLAIKVVLLVEATFNLLAWQSRLTAAFRVPQRSVCPSPKPSPSEQQSSRTNRSPSCYLSTILVDKLVGIPLPEDRPPSDSNILVTLPVF